MVAPGAILRIPFEKVGRNIRLTEEGRYFQEKVDVALQELNLASVTLRNSRTSAPVVVRMGVVSGVLRGPVAKQIAAYMATNERIRFRMIESSAEELLDLVRQEKLDMAIVDNTNRDRSLHFRKLCQRNFYAAMPADHPLANNEYVLPQQLSHEPQVVFHDAMESAFSQWASGVNADERVLSIVNTARSALDLVEAGVGICLLSEDCLEDRPELRFVKIRNWHQALYMCILYDKWLEPPVWGFVESLVKVLRSMYQQNPSL